MHPLASNKRRRMVIGTESVADELPRISVVLGVVKEDNPVVTNPFTAFAPGAQLHSKLPVPD
jgi:hypothetical protein